VKQNAARGYVRNGAQNEPACSPTLNDKTLLSAWANTASRGEHHGFLYAKKSGAQECSPIWPWQPFDNIPVIHCHINQPPFAALPGGCNIS
jgi:hypothetical protein